MTWKLMKAINFIIVKIFSILPLKSNYIVFNSKPDFCDNTWAFYDYLKEKGLDKKYHIIWLVEHPELYCNNNNNNTLFISNVPTLFWLKRDYYLTVSKFVIYTHVSPIRSWRKNQVFIHTRHSASQLKDIYGADEKYDYKRKSADYHLICGNDGYNRVLSRPDYPECSLIRIGMPRLDLLFQHEDCVKVMFGQKNYNKVIIAMETFKQTYDWNDSSCKRTYGLNILTKEEELLLLDDYLCYNNLLLIIKPHPMQLNNYAKISSLSNIKFITNEILKEKGIQLYQLLENTDALITDYSSVFYDYLLTNKPIAFTIGDIGDYKRGFIIDNPLEEMTGNKIKTLDDLKNFLYQVMNNEDNYIKERENLKKRVFDYTDNNNCKRLYTFLIEKGLKKGGKIQ